ncbi:peptidase S8/S53 domain-containing protein [Bisporella sp. PMI_857]|nr:peptidase S8/S53 domain-containing protein [Bisporella sp. PMI_857]
MARITQLVIQLLVAGFAHLGCTTPVPNTLLQLRGGEIIPDRYIISLKSDVDVESHLSWVSNVHRRSISRRDTAGIRSSYAFGGFKGYSGEFDTETMEAIRANENVIVVDVDTVAYITAIANQTNAPWGLRSIASRSPVPNGDWMGHWYAYDESAGEGTYAYVLDTGLMMENSEFQGRAVRGYNAWGNHTPTVPFGDQFGHGSHAAGIIGSKTYDVVKKAILVDVKVCQDAGYSTAAHILDGINWAVNNITKTPGRAAKSVLNMSLALPTNQAINAAIEAAYNLGVLTVVGAGNDGKDASTRSPASAPFAITAGAIDWTNTRPTWSNYGPLVDIFAPGVRIPSLWNKEGIESVNDGTSMATPHVAGLALYLKAVEGLANPSDTTARIQELASKGQVISAEMNSPNLLAYSGAA